MTRSIRIIKPGTCCAWLLGASSLSLPAASSTASDANMRARIAEVRKTLEAERNLPEEERWRMDEDHVRNLEELAEDGDAQASQFLELARVRIAKLRRERYIRKWGRALNDPDITEELREHARRTAQLKRVRLMAYARSFPNLLRRAEELIDAERSRHEQRLRALVSELSGDGELPNDDDSTESMTAQ